MTQPPDWWSQLSPGIHNAPARAGGELILPFAWQQLEQIVQFFINAWLAKVAVALGAIEIFGWSPYAALVGLGQEFQAAKDNWDTIFAELSVGDISGLLNWLNNIPGEVINGITVIEQQILNAIAGALGHPAPPNATPTDILAYLQAFPADLITGAFNLGNVQIGTTSLDDIFNGTGQFIGVLNSAATGALNSALTYGGHALSTVFTNITASTGGLNAAGLTGQIDSAVQIGSAQINSIFSGTGQFIGVLNSAATGALNTAITVAGQQIGTVQANAQGIVNGINNAAAGLLSGGSALLADAQTNINLLFASAPQFLQGLSGAFGQSATDAAYAAAAAAQSAQAAALAQQQSAFNAVFNVSPATAGNVSVSVDFSGMANASNLSGIMSPGNTNIGITSGAAAVQSTNSTPGVFEVFPTQTVSDYQSATYTFGPPNTLGSNTAGSGNNDTNLICRSNSARNTYVGALLTTSGGALPVRVYLVAVVSGTLTTLSYANIAIPSVGNTMRLIVGDPSSSSPYAMQVLLNGTPIITYTDSSHVSQLGASYRYVGFGMRCGSPYSTNRGIDIRAVTYQDNPPAPASYPFSGTPAAGTKGRMYVSNDVGLIQRDNGSAWERIWGGPLGYFTAPPSSGWSSVNHGTETFAADKDAMLLTAPSVASGDARLWVRTLSPASNYSATFYVESLGAAANSWEWGICLRESSGGKFVSFGIGISNPGGSSISQYSVCSKWNSATSFNANYRVADVSFMGGVPNWFRVRDDGSNRYMEYSYNGVDWMTFHSVGRTDFLGTAPNQIGLKITNNNSGQPLYVRLRSLSGIS